MGNFRQAAEGNYKTGRSGSTVEYIVLHYTANEGDTAKNNADYFARENVGASAHYFVDENYVWQSVLEKDTAYHCGGKSYKHPYCRNSNSIGVEMCDSVTAVPEATRKRAAALVRELMERYKIPVENVLRHYDVTGKRCPAPWVKDEGAWLAFLEELEGGEIVTKAEAKAIVKEKAGLSDSTIAFLDCYKWAEDLFIKLATAMK